MKELKEKIAELKRKATNKSLPSSAVAALQKMIDKSEAELTELESKEEKPKEEAKKEKAPKAEKPKKEKKEKVKSDVITVDGKEYDVADCEEAIKAWNARKKQHDEAAGAYKTKPVTAKVASNVATAIKQTVNEIPKSKSSKTVVKELKAVQDAVEDLFSSIEKLLGKKISDAKIKEALDILKQAIKEAKKE